MLDALIVAVGFGMVSWIFLMAPIVADPGQSLTEIGVALAYPMLDILLLGVMVRLLLAPGRHVPSLRFLIGAVIAFLLADLPVRLPGAGRHLPDRAAGRRWLAAGRRLLGRAPPSTHRCATSPTRSRPATSASPSGAWSSSPAPR